MAEAKKKYIDVEEYVGNMILDSFNKTLESSETPFFSSVVGGNPKNGSTGKPYNGINIPNSLIALGNADKCLPILATRKQIFDIMKKYKNSLPEKSDTFDPERPLRGVKLPEIAKVVHFVQDFYKKGTRTKITDKEKIAEYENLSDPELRKKGINASRYLVKSKTGLVSIEEIEHLLPQEYKDQFPEFKMKEDLDKLKMNPEKENLHYLQMTHNLEAALGIDVVVHEKGNSVFYRPFEDTVNRVPRDRFTSDKNLFYATSHECHHWTGHKTRLNREFATSVDPAYKRKYALEEIKTELANALTCIKLGLPTELQHTSYVKGYIESIEGDNNKIFYSCYQDATKSSNYVTERYEGYIQKMEQTLKDTLDKDLKAEPAMVSDGKVYQTFSIKTKPEKTFVVIVSLDGKTDPIIKNKSVFNEFVESKEPKGDLDKFEASLKSDFKEYATANYAMNRAVLDDKEKKRKAEKLEEKPKQENKNKNERPKLKA